MVDREFHAQRARDRAAAEHLPAQRIQKVQRFGHPIIIARHHADQFAAFRLHARTRYRCLDVASAVRAEVLFQRLRELGDVVPR